MNNKEQWKNSFTLLMLMLFALILSGCKWLDGDGHELPSDVNLLASLSVSEGSLSPAFGLQTTSYNVDVENAVESIQVTATLEHSRASITINGVATASGAESAPISLPVGSTIIPVVVTAENGITRTVTITVTRAEPVALSNNADLSALTVSVGDLVPVFATGTNAYSVSVNNATDSMTVTPTTSDANATVSVNTAAVDSGSPSAAIVLAVGDTTISVVVIAEDGTTVNTYTITVTRDDPLSNNADLSGLALSVGSLSPTFDAGALAYTASVAFTNTAITVTPTLADSNASVTVNGLVTTSGSPSASIDLLEGENTITVSVLAEDGVTGKTYEVVVTRQAAASFAQQAYLKASIMEEFDNFGWSVALSGDTLAVGANSEDSSATGGEADNSVSFAGAVYVFTRSSDVWSQQAFIKASNAETIDDFGRSVALSGDTLVVGAPFEDSSATGGEADNSADAAGAVYVYTRSGTTWSQQAYLKASNAEAEDFFGWSVALSGDTVAVGAYKEDSSTTGGEADNSAEAAGAVYVYTRSSSVWSQQAYLKASNADELDRFGWSVALSGDSLAVASNKEDSSATGGEGDNSALTTGAVYVFTRSSGSWSQQAYLKASNAEEFDRFGESIALSGDSLAVGATREDGSVTGGEVDNSVLDAGAVYVFTRSGTTWSQQAYLKASNAGGGDEFGKSVALSGDILAVGTRFEDSSATGGEADNSASSAGAVYVFTRSGTTWSQQAYLKASNAEAVDRFGQSVALSGDSLAVGANDEDSSADGGENDNSASNAGAVYVFKTQ